MPVLLSIHIGDNSKDVDVLHLEIVNKPKHSHTNLKDNCIMPTILPQITT